MWQFLAPLIMLVPAAVAPATPASPVQAGAVRHVASPVTRDIVYVMGFTASNVIAVDPAAGRVVATIPTAARPAVLHADPGGTRVFATLRTGAVAVIDTATNTVVRTLTGPYGEVVPSPDGRYLYAQTGTQLLRLDATTYATLGSGPLKEPLGGVTVTPDGRRLLGAGSDDMGVVDTATLTETVIGGCCAFDYTNQTAPDPLAADRVYATTLTGGLNAVDLSTGAAVVAAHFPVETYGLAVAPDATRVYVGLGAEAGVAVYDTAAGTVRYWPVEGGTGVLALSADGSHLYLAAEIARAVSVVDTATGTRTALIPVGEDIDYYPDTLTLARVPQRTADISVAMTAPARTSLGDAAKVTATVTDAGPLDAPGVTLTLRATAGPAVALSTPTPGCAVHGGTVDCAFGDLPAGATRTVTVDAEPGATGTVELTAHAESPAGPPDPDPAGNTASRSVVVDDRYGCTVVGTLGDDVLNGTPGADVICALSGDDQIVAGAGNDVVHAGSGRDVVLGGSGSDRLVGGPGTDVLRGGTGADSLDGRDGVGGDVLDGGTGTDTCASDPGDVRLGCP